jgi:hypothetical protein
VSGLCALEEEGDLEDAESRARSALVNGPVAFIIPSVRTADSAPVVVSRTVAPISFPSVSALGVYACTAVYKNTGSNGAGPEHLRVEEAGEESGDDVGLAHAAARDVTDAWRIDGDEAGETDVVPRRRLPLLTTTGAVA